MKRVCVRARASTARVTLPFCPLDPSIVPDLMVFPLILATLSKVEDDEGGGGGKDCGCERVVWT